MEVNVKINFTDIKKLLKTVTEENKIKVGLLADGGLEVSENLDLAGLGAIQEFGCQIPVTDKMRGFLSYKFGIHLKKDTTHIVIPSRSFLQMPIERQHDLMKKFKKKVGNKDDILYYILKTGDTKSLAILLGASAVEQIQEAFDTGGWGTWAPNSEITVKGKGSSMPLVDTGNLRQHITFEVNDGG